jgi:predicted ATPase/class 3 adenylate cyclase
VLALLILNANHVVPRDRLVDEVWDEDPPETAVAAVQVYVSRLRKLLRESSLQTQPPGYLLEAEPDDVDFLRFERLLKEGRSVLAAGDLERGSGLMQEALGLWRGPALAEFSQPFARLESGRLDDVRVAALEERIDADLELGRHASVVGELETLVAANPHREHLREQLMLALYRCGRQTEALEVYRDVRATLDEIGIEPGESLRTLERQILSQDRELDAPTQLEPISGASPAVAPDAPAGAPGRKRVTILFASLATTNEADEDPEQTAALFDRFHAAAADEIEHAGGMLEQGIVGALLAVFGARESDRDDHAARAARAALALHDRLTRAFGDKLSSRLSIESGDVILGRPGSLAMGKPVVEASRLIGLAQPGDIVVGHRAGQAIDADFELRERGYAHVLVGVRAQPAAREVRKTVTILFADLVESTRLGHELDPEALSALMSRYFERMKDAVVRHGGIVEKFIGDAVTAIFGVPVLHEDDPLRAVRAAVEMRESLAALNGTFERDWGVRLRGRIGINTGEVMAGDHLQGHLIVTGRAVNVAKRLEEAAESDEILISDGTHRLVRDAVSAIRVTDRAVKGGMTLEGFAVTEVRPNAPGRARRFDTPLVDRDHELRLLLDTFDRVLEDRECHLLTVLGEAGVGKSRLMQELAANVETRATVLRGRCLPYGEGITYWPLSEVVHQVTRVDGSTDVDPSTASLTALLAHDDKAELIAELIFGALGLGDAAAVPGEQTFWAFRKLFESTAQQRPLVVVFDDLQWAEPTFMDLIDYLADQTRDAPIMLVCVARPELLDNHAGWGGGKRHASVTSLEPLRDDDTRRLITNLLGRGSLPRDVEQRIADVSEGNALFVEELLAMLVDDKRLAWEDDHWVASDDLERLEVPQEINAFLAARLEHLPAGERALLVRASVEGAVFHRDALRELAPELSESSLQASLATLVRRDVIRPEQTNFAGDEAYRFRHVLIREAAYASLAKATRADLHERYADWLERTAAARIREFEEIVGYHLEQAYTSRAGLRVTDDGLAGLGVRAADRLASAGRRAMARSDLPAAIGLLERAREVMPAREPGRARLLVDLGAALIEAGSEQQEAQAESVLSEARLVAAAAENECADAHARVQQEFLQLLRVEHRSTDEAAQTVESVVPVFERFHDEHGQCSARRLEALLRWNSAQAASAAKAWEQAAEHARRAGDEDQRSEILSWVSTSLFFGPIPVPEGIRRCEEIRVEVRANPGSSAWTLRSLAGLGAMDGQFDLARNLLADANAIFEELGQTRYSAISDIDGIVEFLAGDLAAAERRLRKGYCVLEELGDRAFRPTTAAHLAQVLLAQGNGEEALRFTRIGEDLGADDDLLTQVVWRGVRARILAAHGRNEEAENLALDAVALGERTDFLNTRAGALLDLAEVYRRTGRAHESNEAATRALLLYEQKRNRVAAQQVRADLAVFSER